VDLGSFSFPLIRRCRGVIGIEQVEAARRVKLEPDEIRSQPGADETAPKTGDTRLDPLYVVELPGGYATHQGGHVTRDSLLVDELSRYLDEPIERHRLLRSCRPFHRLKEIDGPVLSLAAPCQYNYYHWMLEALPKLALFRRQGAPETAPVYAESGKAFQSASLDLLGIAPASRIDSRRHQSIRARALWAATIPSPSGAAHPWAVDWLRHSFFAALPATDEPPIGCLVVSRRQASSRKVVNEDELLAALTPLQPTCVVLEELSLTQQIDHFRRARLIVAPHGAGLTNLIFARPEVTVLELFGATYRNRCFERLAAAVGCGYQALIHDDARDSTSGEMNIRVLPELIRAAAHAAFPRG
jgi:capsular polysaccharide biosynthesis protein